MSYYAATDSRNDEHVHKAYPDADHIAPGLWIVNMPKAAEAQMERGGHAEWTDEHGIRWEAETP